MEPTPLRWRQVWALFRRLPGASCCGGCRLSRERSMSGGCERSDSRRALREDALDVDLAQACPCRRRRTVLDPARTVATAGLLRLLVAYQTAWDFLDEASERGAIWVSTTAAHLHRALVDALDPHVRVCGSLPPPPLRGTAAICVPSSVPAERSAAAAGVCARAPIGAQRGRALCDSEPQPRSRP